jgi:hypothetical protein
MMKRSIIFLFAAAAFLGATVPAFARYEIFLSTSPNNKYRVAVGQEILRRVGDQVYFEYPIYLTNKAGRKMFFIEKGTVPFVSETDRGTFTVDRGLVKFDWAADSKKCFLHLKVFEDEWRVYLVDVAGKSAKNVTSELLTLKMARKVSRKKWECQRPTIELLKWHKPDQAIFHLSTICNDPADLKNKHWGYENWILYSTTLKKVLKECPGCEKDDALKFLAKEPKKKKPKPTPTPEETPYY